MSYLTDVTQYAKNHTIRECCCKFSKNYFTMYSYLKQHNITFKRQPFIGADNSNYKHGCRHTRLFKIWVNMRQRCSNKCNQAYKNYGGRGVKVCNEWQDFLTFKEWSLNNNYTDTLTIDRINVNGDYCPDNCRWVSRRKQNLNRRNNRFITYKGQTKTVKEWSEIYNMHYDKLRWRLDNWKDLDKVFNYKN